MKITNYKSQITNKFQITMTKITKIIKKRITTTIMGQDVRKHCTRTVRISKVFGSPETFFQKGLWPPEALLEKN
jgi:hypothetical protein